MNTEATAITLDSLSAIDTLLVDKFLESGFDSKELIETTQDIQLPFGHVQAKDWYFDGIRIGYSDWHYTEKVAMEFKFDLKADIITLYFNLQGRTRTTPPNYLQGKSFYVGNYQHNLFYSPVSEGELLNEDLRLTTFMIQFSLDSFLKLTQDANDVLKRFADDVVKGKPVALSKSNLYVSAEMYQAINAIIHCRYQDGLKKMFLLSKSIELLVMQAEAYNLAQATSYRHVKTEYDKERLIYAREYLMQHVDSPPSLSELSKIAGINEYKLKRGFKEMFGNTVFGYLSEMRLDLAKRNLIEKKKSASELAYELGYSSIQHFSVSFKTKFGFPPSKLRA